MAKVKSSHRLTNLAGTGVRELPANAAWLLSKVLKPAVSASSGASGAATSVVGSVSETVSDTASSAAETAGAVTAGMRRKTRAAGRSVRAAVPGLDDNSIDSLLRQADEAAEEAREKETRALALAQEAKDRADDAERTAREMDEHVRQVDSDARAQAEEHLERVRLAEEAERRKALDQAEEEAAARTREKEQEAERAQERARQAIQEANRAVAEARKLAGQASKAAQQVASQATQEADRLAALAHEPVAARRQVAQAARRGAGRRPPPAGQRGARTSGRPSERRSRVRGAQPGNGNGATLRTVDQVDRLTKAELIRLAGQLDVADSSTMNKQDLVRAVVRVGGVPLDRLNKDELLRLGRGTGAELQTSMTKPELIAAISTSRTGSGRPAGRPRRAAAGRPFHREDTSDGIVHPQEQMGSPAGVHRVGFGQRHSAPGLQGHARRRQRGRRGHRRERGHFRSAPPGRVVKLTTVAVFGVGYVLGTRAGRERYEQILELAHNASGKFAASGARRSLEEYGARLEAYASQSRCRASRARRGRKWWPDAVVTACPAVNWPERARHSFRLDLRGLDPARGDMVIGAFVLARLLGIRLLTLEARVVVHEDDGGGPGRSSPPARRTAGPPGSARPVPPAARPPSGISPGSERLARAVWLVEQGADTLERTRRAQYRG